MLHVSPRTGAKFRMQGFRPLCWPPSSGLTLSELSTTVKGKIHPSVTKAMYSYTDWALHHSRRCHLHRSWCELCSPELYSAAALAVTRFQPSVSCLVERILGRRNPRGTLAFQLPLSAFIDICLLCKRICSISIWYLMRKTVWEFAPGPFLAKPLKAKNLIFLD